MHNFRELKIWSEGIQLGGEMMKIARQLPDFEKFNMSSQQGRAALSVPLNIAEGSSRKSKKEFDHYLTIALGSCFEMESIIRMASIAQYVSQAIHEEYIVRLINLQKMISAFRAQL